MLIPVSFKNNSGSYFFRQVESDKLNLNHSFFSKSLKEYRSCIGGEPWVEVNIKEPFGNVKRIEIGAIIFHTSRCGSTWLCEMLKQHEQVMVLSEPPVFNQIVRAREIDNDIKVALLREVYALYRAWAKSLGKILVVKLTSYNSIYHSLHASCTDAEKIFLYTNSINFLSSILNSPPNWMRESYLSLIEDGLMHDYSHIVDGLNKEISLVKSCGFIAERYHILKYLVLYYYWISKSICTKEAKKKYLFIDYSRLRDSVETIIGGLGLEVLDIHLNKIDKVSLKNVKTGEYFSESGKDHIKESLRYLFNSELKFHKEVVDSAYQDLVAINRHL